MLIYASGPPPSFGRLTVVAAAAAGRKRGLGFVFVSLRCVLVVFPWLPVASRCAPTAPAGPTTPRPLFAVPSLRLAGSPALPPLSIPPREARLSVSGTSGRGMPPRVSNRSLRSSTGIPWDSEASRCRQSFRSSVVVATGTMDMTMLQLFG